MSDIKWIKLSINVFDDEKFDAIKTLPDSNDIQLAWIKLLCLAGKCNESGFLMLTREIPYTDEMLASRFGMDVGVVQRALSIFQKLEMVEVVDNVYMVSNWLKYQSGDELEKVKRQNRERQQRHREKQKESLLEQKNDSNVTNNVTDNVKNNAKCSISYSYSNNSNIDNLLYILNNHIYSDTDYLKNNKNLYESIKEWMIYKDNKKPYTQNHYDTEMGIKKLLTSIIEHSKEYGVEEVIKIIDASISNNYQGIIWNELEKRGKKKQEPSTEKPLRHRPTPAPEPEDDGRLPMEEYMKLNPNI